jgi:hypothetical protein
MQPLIRLVAFRLLRLLLAVPWFVLSRFAILIGRNKSLLLSLMLRSLMLLWRSSARCSFPWWLLLDLQFLSMQELTLGSDVTTYALVVASRRLSLGRRHLSGLCHSRNISTNDSLSLIHTGRWRLGDCGFRSRGDIRSRSYIPESCFVCWALLDW